METGEMEAKFTCYLQLFEKSDVQICSLSVYVKHNKKPEEVLVKEIDLSNNKRRHRVRISFVMA
jgi:hypothetical protein